MPSRVNVPRGSGAQRYQAPQMRLGRSQFDLTHSHKSTFEVGNLVPIFCTEVLPGDTMTCRQESLVRIFSPLDAPLMDDILVEVDYFYVPNRLVWTNWEAFLGAHDAAGAQDTEYLVPICPTGKTVQVSSVAHYLGVPLGLQTAQVQVSVLPFRAIGLIYDEWYRDQNVIDSEGIVKDDTASIGVASIDMFVTGQLFKSAKKHDYFTSALPYTQKGDPVAIALDVGTTGARVYSNQGEAAVVAIGTSGNPDTRRGLFADGSASNQVTIYSSSPASTHALFVDLSDVTIGIEAMREAAAIQQLLERDARGGTRHPELIRAHFGVDVPDYRTQRPEYLGGGKGFINVSPVANTSATASENQAELKGTGVGYLRASWAKSFVEHGHVIGLLRARGQVTYQQGLDRMWSRRAKLDFMWPELTMLGEQAILNKEIYVSNSAATDDAVFGYQERYAEYRYKKSIVSGAIDSNAASSLDFWHLAEDFGALPTLGRTFIQDATPMSRVTTVDSEPDFIIDARFDLRVARALPVRPVPTLGTARF